MRILHWKDIIHIHQSRLQSQYENKKRDSLFKPFSGCGGLDIGFLKNEFRCLGAYDIDPSVVEVHKYNLNTPAFIHDVSNQDLPGINQEKVDVVIAGSPCQGFSTIGKRKINDPRNYLLLTGGEIAIKYNAKVFVCENVLGSNSGEHKKYWNTLIDKLHVNGFQTQMVRYDASEYGVPQLRKRLILYAWRSNKLKEFKLLDCKKPKKILCEVLTEITPLNHNLDFIPTDSAEFIIANSIKQGQKLCDVRGGERSVHTWTIPEVFGSTTIEERLFLSLIMKLRRQIRRREFGDADPVDEKFLRDYFGGKTKKVTDSLIEKKYIKRVNKKYLELTHTFNGKYRRLDMDKQSPTVDTRFGSFKNFLHPIENRALSVREAARIQGFDDKFIFLGPIKKQYEMIGNAVPPQLSNIIAKTIKQNILPHL